MRRDVGVLWNPFVYSAILYAINRLAAVEGPRSERLELLKEEVFEECRALGHVSIAAMTAMR